MLVSRDVFHVYYTVPKLHVPVPHTRMHAHIECNHSVRHTSSSLIPCIRYIYCPKCFNEIQGDTVTVGDDPLSATRIPKSQFKELRNNAIDKEP